MPANPIAKPTSRKTKACARMPSIIPLRADERREQRPVRFIRKRRAVIPRVNEVDYGYIEGKVDGKLDLHSQHHRKACELFADFLQQRIIQMPYEADAHCLRHLDNALDRKSTRLTPVTIRSR